MFSLRFWIAVGLLAGSWMFGLGYFYPADYYSWSALLAIAVVLLYGTDFPLPSARNLLVAVVFLLPASVWTPRPYTIIPLFMLIGLLLQFLPDALQAIKTWARGLVAAGSILLAQSLVLAAYSAQTARSHELFAPLPQLLAGVAKLFSIDAAYDGVNIVFRTVRQTHRLAPTWEWFFDPVSLCFLVGGMFFLGMEIAGRLPDGKRWSALIRSIRILTLLLLAWLPLRAVLLMAIYVHRVVNFDPDRSLYVMNHFFAHWPLLLYTVVPMLFAWRFITPPLPLGEGPGVRASVEKTYSTREFYPALLLTFLAVAIFTFAVEYSPVGKRKEGRVAVVERHSTWEPTFLPSDVPTASAWYGERGSYNYVQIYDYLGQYYRMSRIMPKDKIDDDTLNDLDVLIIKTPCANDPDPDKEGEEIKNPRYSKTEIDAVLRFVRRGGGVLFIGDHTNLYGMGTAMNDIAREMGFVFRDDLLFSNQRTKIRRLEDIKDYKNEPSLKQDEPESPTEKTCYHQTFTPPWPAHPALQYMPPMEFAVSCSIDPGFSGGRPVIANTGLWNMPPEYHHSNFHPIPQHVAPMRYGAFVQVWATQYGKGRAMAFTDSTVFSNFCVYQPGKAEVMLGMVEWLNHDNPWLGDPRILLNVLASLVLIAAAWSAWRGGFPAGGFVCFAAAGMAGWIAACGAVASLHRANMPMSEARQPMYRVVVDRTASNVPLMMGAYRKGRDGAGYGVLEQWIPRTKIDGRGCYTIRQGEKNAFSGDALAIICPTENVSDAYLAKMTAYVENGGKILLFDSPDSSNSTANRLLEPFKMRVDSEKTVPRGTLEIANRWPSIPVDRACRVTGGRPIARINGQPVAAETTFGKGKVVVIGFGSLFNDLSMGGNWMADHDSTVKRRHNVLFALIHFVFLDKPVEPTSEAFGNSIDAEMPDDLTAPASEKEKSPQDTKDIPLKERDVGE
jgi:hypothetical protein